MDKTLISVKKPSNFKLYYYNQPYTLLENAVHNVYFIW